MTTNHEVSNRWANSMMPNYSTPTIALSHGSGSYVWDVEGNRYLDLLGGIAVSVLGHSHREVVNAICKQTEKFAHSSNLYAHETGIELAEKLIKLFNRDSRVFFCQDGATANEAALKLVRKYGYSLRPDGSKQVIVAMNNGFHGRTSGALAITGNVSKRDGFAPFGYEVRFVDFNDVASLESAMKNDVVAVFVEPVQGEGGMHIGTTDFLKSCQRLSQEHQALLVVDEVQSGVGRTGSFFNFSKHGLQPDIVTLAKGLGAGLPIGALIVSADVSKHFQPGDHGSTFGGNPVSVAAANVVVDTVSKPEFLNSVSENSEWLFNEISNLNFPNIKNIRFSGLWFGIELLDESAASITNNALSEGFLINAVKPNVLRLAPALNITKEELQTFLDALPKLVK